MYQIKRDKRSRQSCGRIYGALCRLMAKKEYRSISVTELAEEAQVGRATFYRNFDTVDDVLRMKCDERFAEMGRMLLESKRTAGAEKPHKLFLEFWYQDSEIIELIMQAQCYEYIVKANQKMFSALLREHMGTLQLPEKFTDYFMIMQSGLAISILLKWIENKKDIPPDEMGELMEQTFISLNRFREDREQPS